MNIKQAYDQGCIDALEKYGLDTGFIGRNLIKLKDKSDLLKHLIEKLEGRTVQHMPHNIADAVEEFAPRIHDIVDRIPPTALHKKLLAGGAVGGLGLYAGTRKAEPRGVLENLHLKKSPNYFNRIFRSQ